MSSFGWASAELGISAELLWQKNFKNVPLWPVSLVSSVSLLLLFILAKYTGKERLLWVTRHDSLPSGDENDRKYVFVIYL